MCVCIFLSDSSPWSCTKNYVCTTFDGKNIDLDCKDTKPAIAKFFQDLNIMKKTNNVLQLCLEINIISYRFYCYFSITWHD